MNRAGRCACGAVTAMISGEPAAVRQCWCRQCQQAASGGPTHNAMFNTADVDLSGELASHAYLAASGNTLTHYFCAQCGTQVYAQSSARPQFRTVRLGFLEPGHGLRPQMAIWLDDAPDWAQIDPAIEHHPQQPPAPPPKD
jgi:hypothetical protein